MSGLFDKLEAKVIAGFLLALFVGSFGIAIAEQFFDTQVTSAWNAPLVLLSLWLIVRLALLIPDIGTNVESIGRQVKSLVDAAEATPVEKIDTVTEFYDSLSRSVAKAQHTLDLTHIRDTPPADFGPTAVGFFNEVFEWCAAHESRSVRRVIAVPNPEMRAWAEQLREKTKELPRFEVRVLDWHSAAPAINFAVVDEKAVFTALTGAMAGRTRGFAVDDEAVSRSFMDYFENLWRNSDDLAAWLAAHSDEG